MITPVREEIEMFTKDDLETLREALIEANCNGLIVLTDARVERLTKKIDAALAAIKK